MAQKSAQGAVAATAPVFQRGSGARMSGPLAQNGRFLIKNDGFWHAQTSGPNFGPQPARVQAPGPGPLAGPALKHWSGGGQGALLKMIVFFYQKNGFWHAQTSGPNFGAQPAKVRTPGWGLDLGPGSRIFGRLLKMDVF